MTPTPDPVAIDIHLPLPADIVSTVIRALGVCYPGMTMEGVQNDHRRDVMRLRVPEAENYVSMDMEVRDGETNAKYVVSISHSKDRTPHALRMAAEAENNTLRNRITELEARRPHTPQLERTPNQ